MNYYAVFLPMKDATKSKEHRQAHLDYIQEMREQGRIFQFGTLVDGAGGLIIYKGDNLEEVTAWAEADPYVKIGARGCEVHEWAMKTDYTFTK